MIAITARLLHSVIEHVARCWWNKGWENVYTTAAGVAFFGDRTRDVIGVRIPSRCSTPFSSYPGAHITTPSSTHPRATTSCIATTFAVIR